MSNGTTTQRSPRGLTRRAARLPIWLYRLGLGWVLGGRFLLLTHIGRVSGKPRQVVLEVVRHDPKSGTYIIASGWGERADWFRNIQQRADVLVQVGSRRMEAVARRLPTDAAAVELRDYAQRHPQAVRALARVMIGEPFDGSEAASRSLAGRVPLVALEPRS